MGLLLTTESILCKTGIRSDALWTHPLLYSSTLLRRFPVDFDVRALMESQYWQPRKIRELQATRLRETLAAAAHIPMWHERFTRTGLSVNTPLSTEIFTRLPLNTKEDFTSREYDGYTKRTWRGNLLRNRTSGSTGKPLEFFQDRHYELRQYGICARMLRTAAAGKDVPVVAIRARMRAGFSLDPRHFFFVSGYNSVRYRLPQLLEHLRGYDGKIILYGFSSALLELARLCEEKNVSIPCAATVASGEALQVSQRQELHEAFKSNVYLCYTTSELGWLGFECEHHLIHINEESAYVEITDNSGVPLPHGEEGRIVVTPFDTRVMPFIRYDTGDRGTITHSSCPCGRTLRTIKVHGRQVEYLSFASNRVVSLLDISSAFDIHATAIQQFQIVRTGKSSISIKVIPRKHFENSRDKIEEQLRSLTHPALRIEWEVVNEIPEGPNGKALCFISAITRPV